MSLVAPGSKAPTRSCSRAGCQAHGVWQVRWRNPRIHSTDRVKVWLACDEHREFLAEFVGTRGFLIDVVPLTAEVANE